MGIADHILPLGDWLGPEAHEGGIWASRLEFGPRGWDMGLQAEKWAWRLGGGGGYEGGEGEGEEGEGGENSPYV